MAALRPAKNAITALKGVVGTVGSGAEGAAAGVVAVGGGIMLHRGECSTGGWHRAEESNPAWWFWRPLDSQSQPYMLVRPPRVELGRCQRV